MLMSNVFTQIKQELHDLVIDPVLAVVHQEGPVQRRVHLQGVLGEPLRVLREQLEDVDGILILIKVVLQFLPRLRIL